MTELIDSKQELVLSYLARVLLSTAVLLSHSVAMVGCKTLKGDATPPIEALGAPNAEGMGKPTQADVVYIMRAPRLGLAHPDLGNAVSHLLFSVKNMEVPGTIRAEATVTPNRAEISAPRVEVDPRVHKLGTNDIISQRFTEISHNEIPPSLSREAAPSIIAKDFANEPMITLRNDRLRTVFYADTKKVDVNSKAIPEDSFFSSEFVKRSEDLHVKLEAIGTTSDISLSKNQTAIVLLPQDHPIAAALAVSPQKVVSEGTLRYTLAGSSHEGYSILYARHWGVHVQPAPAGVLKGNTIHSLSKSLEVQGSVALLRAKDVLAQLGFMHVPKNGQPPDVLESTLTVQDQKFDVKIQVIGKGQFGVVYRADFIKPGEEKVDFSIALKEQPFEDPGLYLNELMHNEAFSGLPNFATFYAGRLIDNGHVNHGYIATELLAGSWLEARSQMLQLQITDMLIGGCDAVAAVEAAGRVHHDIKVENFLFDHKGVTRLSDLAGLDTQKTRIDLDSLFSGPGTYWPYETSKLFSSKKTAEAYNSAEIDRFDLGLAMLEMRMKKEHRISDFLDEKDVLFPTKVKGPPIIDGDALGAFLRSSREKLFEPMLDDEFNLFLKMIGNDHASRPSAAEAARQLRKMHGRTLLQISDAR